MSVSHPHTNSSELLTKKYACYVAPYADTVIAPLIIDGLIVTVFGILHNHLQSSLTKSAAFSATA